MSSFVVKPIPPSLLAKAEPYSALMLVRRGGHVLRSGDENPIDEILRNFLSILDKRGLGRTEIELEDGKIKTAKQIAGMYRKRKDTALKIIATAADLGGEEGTNAMLAEAAEPLFQRMWKESERDPKRISGFFFISGVIYSDDQMSWIWLQIAKPVLSVIRDPARAKLAEEIVDRIESSLVMGRSESMDADLQKLLYRLDETTRTMTFEMESIDMARLLDVDRINALYHDRRILWMLSAMGWGYANGGYIQTGTAFSEIESTLRFLKEYSAESINIALSMADLQSKVLHKILQPTLLTMTRGSSGLSSKRLAAPLIGAVAGAVAYGLLRR